MKRAELEHVLRAASRVIEERDLLVVGSAAILAMFDETVLPAEATRTDEVDLVPWEPDPDEAKSDRINGDIGELSPFHRMYGYYGHGVDLSTAKLPRGWRDRLILYQNSNTKPGRGRCLEPHDLLASKLAAFRDKDREFAAALMDAGLVSAEVVAARVEDLEDVDPETLRAIREWLRPYLRPRKKTGVDG